MKKMALSLMICGVAAQVWAAEWLTDLPKALDLAKAQNKVVLVEFTGSDWCPPCKALHKNVMTSPEFQAYAEKNLVLVEADFPHHKAQSDELQKANKALADKFGLEGFPTVVVLDAKGRQLSKTVGYDGGKPGAFIAELEKVRTK
jgi:thioredoxin-related protein